MVAPSDKSRNDAIFSLFLHFHKRWFGRIISGWHCIGCHWSEWVCNDSVNYFRFPENTDYSVGQARFGGSGGEDAGYLNDFPFAFPSACYGMIVSHVGHTPSGAGILSASAITSNQFRGFSSIATAANAVLGRYIAIGVNMFYSPSLNIFVNPALKDDYINANSWPDDALAVSDDVYNEFAINTPPYDKIRVAGKMDYPHGH